MANKKNLILIIVAVVIVLAVGGYITYRYFYSPKITANISGLAVTSTPITIINEQTKSNYIPPEVAAVLNLSAYKVDSQVRQLSNGGTQYILSFEANDIRKATNDIRSQLMASKFTASNSTSTNFGAYNSLNNEKVQVLTVSSSNPSIFKNSTSSTLASNSNPMIIISWYK